jgi:hypothetical protein
MLSILVPLAALVIAVFMTLFGLTPEQQAKAEAKRTARAMAKLAREQRIEVERQRREWRAVVEGQKADGSAGFADESEAMDALGGRGGRRSNLDDRWF